MMNIYRWFAGVNPADDCPAERAERIERLLNIRAYILWAGVGASLGFALGAILMASGIW
jgi:hypothetical protein